MLELPDYEVLEKVSENAVTRVYRALRRRTGTRVILKAQSAAPRVGADLRHEFALLSEFDSSGVARAYELVEHGEQVVLVEEDIGGVPLSERITEGPCPVAEFLRIAVTLADVLQQIHHRQIVHRDINPRNIVWNRATGQVQFIDFGLASRLPREQTQPTAPDRIEGSLPYLAPEQTGRMNRAVDYRADFYALGATLYELLTGQRPFAARDALEWVHCHLARVPRTPLELIPTLPHPLSALILKLLAKLAEDRYQSAAGLREDLERCQREWQQGGTIESFFLGANDVSDRFQLPQKLYGREAEVSALLSAFDRVWETGQPEVVLVAGYSGIGKSVLVAELHKPIVARRGYFIRGKFDQFQRGIPYATIAAAFHSLIQQLLAESEERVARWRQMLLEAVGDNGRLMIDLMPQVALIIGPQPPVGELPPDQAQRRLLNVFQRFVGVFTRAEHPLVLFLDDLQWIDAGSIKLLEQLGKSPDTRHLLVLGAYRDNEIDATHPLAALFHTLQKAALPMETLTLAPLAEAHVVEILADTLHASAEQVAALAHVVFGKTRGNPFFCSQFLTALYHDSLLSFDASARHWSYDLAAIEARHFSDNVVTLMLGELQRLPTATQEVLAVAGFLGSEFAQETLALVIGDAPDAISEVLWPALKLELVLRHGNRWRFSHDRVQEAAYSLTPAADRPAMHLSIGRLLLNHLTDTEREEQFFPIVGHLHAGESRITDSLERLGVAALSLQAGEKARQATNYEAAARYFDMGIRFLPERCWAGTYALAFPLHLGKAATEILSGNIADADGSLGVLAEHAHDAIDRAEVGLLRSRIQMTKGDIAGARSTAIQSLQELGVEVRESPEREDVELAHAEIAELMGERSIESLADLPLATDPAMRMAIKLMMSIGTATYLVGPTAWAMHVAQMVILNLRHGNTESSPMLFTYFGFELASGRQRYADAYRFGSMAHALVEKSGGKASRGNLLSFWAYIAVWVRPPDDVLAMLRAAIPVAVENGDLIAAAQTCNFVVLESLIRGVPLGEVQEEAERMRPLIAQSGYRIVEVCMQPRRQLIAMLRGETEALGSLTNPHFDQPAFERSLAGEKVVMGVCCYHLTCLMGQVVAVDFAGAHASALQAEPLVWSIHGTPNQYAYVFYRALAVAGLFPSLPPTEQRLALETLIACRAQLRVWAESNPATFEASALLISAEVARARGEIKRAIPYYDRAISAARNGRLWQHEALAAEATARFYREIGSPAAADHFLNLARNAYASWGALGKVRQLEEGSPDLGRPVSFPMGRTTTTHTVYLDIMAAARATQAISSQIVRDDLLRTLLQVVLEEAGAQFGALLVADGETLRLAATAEVEGQRIQARLLALQPPTVDELPGAILNYVRRTREPIVLEDARQPNPFSTDPYLSAHRPRAVLGLPILRQGAVAGVLYLEHRSATGVFSLSRLAVLEQLAAQAAISLENAEFHEQIRRYAMELEQRVVERTSELATANQELEAFAYSISHDLRAPLRFITKFSGVLLENHRDQLDVRGQSHCTIILQQSLRMTQLIDDLLTFSRWSRAPLRRRDFAMTELVQKVFEETTAPEDRDRIDFQLAELHSAPGDPNLLRQVWSNLLSNAVKYSSKKSRSIVQVSGHADAETVTYQVRDNGAGFDMRYAPKLFGVFRRLHLETDFPGTGVGLAIVRRIVERHGGRIWADSKPNEGATFSFTLPTTKNALPSAPSVISKPAPTE
jgi:predicted ATPase/signal transduction histidine kinase